MSKHMKSLRAMTLMLAITMTTIPLSGCSSPQKKLIGSNGINKEKDDKDSVYVNNNGSWIPYYMFIHNGGSIGSTTQFATKSGTSYNKYTPSTSELSAMKSGSYTGFVGNKTISTAKPSVSTNAVKGTSGTSKSVGGNSTRAVGFGG